MRRLRSVDSGTRSTAPGMGIAGSSTDQEEGFEPALS